MGIANFGCYFVSRVWQSVEVALPDRMSVNVIGTRTMPCPDGDSEPFNDVSRCQNYLDMLERGRLSFEEYAWLLTIRLIDGSEDLTQQCLETIPTHFLPQYRQYLHDLLVPVDFMPSPFAFLAGAFTPERIENKKIELRPRYVAIYQLVNSL